MIVLDLSILNQKGTPMFNSDIFANRPNFGIVGRIFISTDTAAIYRDTGTAWDLISDATGSGTNIYNSDGTLTANRTVSSGNFSLTFNPATTFDTTLTAANNASSLSIFGVNRLSYAAGFSANNIGALYGGSASFGLQTFAGSATFANSNIASGGASINSIDFSSAGSTITMTQSSGLRAMTGNQVQVQYQGTYSGTITHAAIQQNLGFYRPSGASGTLTITNAYSHLINALDDYGAGFTFTNRWGIYQAGASDKNYFAGNLLIGTIVDGGQRLQISGDAKISNDLITGNNFRVDANGDAYQLTTGGAAMYAAIGNSTFPTYGFYNDQGLGMYRVSADILAFSTSSLERCRITSGGSFLIGQSTSDGISLLEVAGYSQIGSVNTTGFQLTTKSNFSAGIRFFNNKSDAADVRNFLIISDTIAYGDFAIQKSTTLGGSTYSNLLYFAANTGNLLVGTSVDSGQKLQILGSVKFSGGINDFESDSSTNYCLKLRNINANSYGLFIQSAATPNLGFPLINITDSTAATSYFRVDSGTGNVGINTSPGTQKLYLNGSMRIDGQTSGTAGGSSGQHLIINCDGTTYKIALLNP